MVKRGKVRDISHIIKNDVTNTSKTPPPTAVRVQTSHFSHPNVPTTSEDHLLSDQELDEKTTAGFENPAFSKDEENRVISNPTVSIEGETIKDVLINPVVSIETASESSKHNTPIKSAGMFNFGENDVNQYNQQLGMLGKKQFLSAPRRASYSVSLIGNSDRVSLAVPDITGSRRPSDPLTFGQDDPFSQLQPLTLSNGLSKSEGRLPPLSPGYLTPSPYDKFPPPSPGLLSTNSAWSELAKLQSRRSSYGDFSEDRCNSNSLSNVSSSLSEHLHQLVRAFSSRTERVKESTIQPPTPSSLDEYDANSDANSGISALDEPEQRQHRLDSFIPSHMRERGPLYKGEEEKLDEYFVDCGCCKPRVPAWFKNPCSIPKTLEPQSKVYMGWLFLVTLCFMYNAWVIPLRAIFPYQNAGNLIYWLVCDYTCDAVYLLDILLVKPRLTYLNSGLVETDSKLTRKNYMQKGMFKFDVLSLLPLDLFYLLWGVVPWLRLPRLCKIQTFWEFYQRCDQAVRSAHVLRIIKTMTYMLFLIHLETCGYYAVSVYEGIGSNRWVYNGEGSAYIRCFYLATKTATSIGNNPIPTNTLEYIFMTIYWVSGVFVFALLIGQIRDIVDAAGRVKALYNKRMDDALRYVKNLNCPKDTQHKVRTWFIYQWQQQKIVDEKKLMNTLPKNLRTDLAIHVHFNTLSKVTLFQDCDKSLLFDLVLKLKPSLYLPGEYVCRKGEVGKEMYIVSQGQVEVVGGPDGATVLATLKEGSVFGEISLLAIAADGNRRTADVRCKGFTNLFILSHLEFEDAMAEYPEAHKLLKKRAKKLLRQNAKLTTKDGCSTGSSKVVVEPIIRSPVRESETPKLLKTVLQVIDPESSIAKRLGTHGGDNADSPAEGDHSGAKEENNVTIKPLPDQEEVEDFYSTMLENELMDQETYEAATKESVKKQFKRDDTVNTEQSEESTDSGVQLPRVTSPPESISKTTSNKDSKESFASSDMNGTFEETCNWVIKQALTSPEVERTRRHSRVEEEAQVKLIVATLTKQAAMEEGELMADFFEDNIKSDNVQNTENDLNLKVEENNSDNACIDGSPRESTAADKNQLSDESVCLTPDKPVLDNSQDSECVTRNSVSEAPPEHKKESEDTSRKSSCLSPPPVDVSKKIGCQLPTDDKNRNECVPRKSVGQSPTPGNMIGNSHASRNSVSQSPSEDKSRSESVPQKSSSQSFSPDNIKGSGPASRSSVCKSPLENKRESECVSKQTKSPTGEKEENDSESASVERGCRSPSDERKGSECISRKNSPSSGDKKEGNCVHTNVPKIESDKNICDKSVDRIKEEGNVVLQEKSDVPFEKYKNKGKADRDNTDDVFGSNNETDSNSCIQQLVAKELAGMNNKPMSPHRVWRNARPSSSSITRISEEYDQNSELLITSLNSDIDQCNFVCEQGSMLSPPDQSKPQEIHMNGIPLQNQITCSVEVHREKSLTPASLKDWVDGANNKQRTESVNSVTKETKLQESSV